ncbi:MAG: tetratricopeptide repeat protein [Stellaceae bacterium]
MALAVAGCTNSGPFAAAEQALSPVAQAQAMQEEFGPAVRLARASRRAGDYASAVNLYRNAVAAGASDPSLLVELGDCLVDAGSPDDGVDTYWKVLGLQKVDPKSGTRLAAIRGLGRAYLQLGQADTALEHWNQAVELAPGDAAALVGKGVTLDTLGRHEEAQASYRSVLADAPHDVPARNNLALSLAMSGNFDEALEIMTPMARASTSTAQLRQNLAVIYGLKGDNDRATSISRMDLDQQATEANLRFFDFVRAPKPN